MYPLTAKTYKFLCLCLQIKHTGTSVEAKVHGIRQLKLLNHGETYETNCPHLLLRIFPVTSADWCGTVTIRCQETGIVAELSYRSNSSFLGIGGNHRVIKGKILDSSSLKVLYEVDGHWDRYYIPPKHILELSLVFQIVSSISI